MPGTQEIPGFGLTQVREITAIKVHIDLQYRAAHHRTQL